MLRSNETRLTVRQGRLASVAFCCCVATLATSCAATLHDATHDGAHATQAAGALDLTLAHSDRSLIELRELRGQPLLLFLFATYDDACQLALTHVERFRQRDPQFPVLGVALQPNAREFLDAYRDALAVSFPLTYDASDVVLKGKTALGRIIGVPAFVLLDAQGTIREVRYGVLEANELTDFVAPVRGK